MSRKASITFWSLLAFFVFIPLLVVTVLLIGTYTFLPPLVEGVMARSVQDDLGLQRTPEVQLRSDPPPEMLLGRFSGAEIVLQDAQLGGVEVSIAAIDLDPFNLDVRGSIAGAALEMETPLSGTLRVEVPEEEVSRLAEAGTGVPVRGVELGEGPVVVRSATRVFGVEVPVSVQGSLMLRGEELVFEPRRLSALGMPVSEELSGQLLRGAGFSYPLKGLPYGAQFSGAEVREGRLVLNGELKKIPVGSSGG